MAKEDNLKPFQPGQSGNPNGRPIGSKSFKSSFKKWLETESDEENPFTKLIEKMSQYDKLTLINIAKARRGDAKAMEILLNHLESKPKQGIDLSGAVDLGAKEIIFKRYKKEK